MKATKFGAFSLALVLALTLSGCAALLGASPDTKPGSSDLPTSSESPSSSAAPTEDSIAIPVPVLEVVDLGESTCNTFEVCTFVNVVANKVCRGAEIDVDLYDENDEYLDTEAISIGNLKQGGSATNLEVGTNDTDADYVEQSDYSCN